MIKTLNEELFYKMLDWYKKYGPVQETILDEEIITSLKCALVNHAYLAFHMDESGFLIIYPYDDNIALNPWFFGGYPIGRNPNSLIEECISFFKKSKYRRLEMIIKKLTLKEVEIPMTLAYEYVDLIKKLEYLPLPDEEFVSIKTVPESELQEVYHNAFLGSDATFYSIQSELERENFWKCLNYDMAIKDDISVALLIDDEIVGFVLVYDVHKYKHISCMCIKKEYQHKGYGKKLLKYVIHHSYISGYEFLSLGTETTMKAFELYRSFDFKIVNKKSYYIEMQ